MVGERRVDKHGRAIYGEWETPPIDAYFAQWMGATVAGEAPYPGNQIGGCHPTDGRRPYATCIRGGWVRSGAWWLHCADCHPAAALNQEETDE
jgi:hypothetical protein